MPMAEARAFHCYSHVFENLGNRTIPSDHTAVRLVIQKPTYWRQQDKRIPGWMSKHPVCCSILKRLHDGHRYSDEPFCALAEFKVICAKAKKHTFRELESKTPDSTGSKLVIASTALRAYRNRHLGALMRCCEAWEPVGQCFEPISFECTDFQKLCQIIANLTRENLTERVEEIANLPWTKTEKDKALPDADLDNELGVPRNPCYVSMLSLMKTATLWKTKTSPEEDFVNIGELFSEARAEGPRHDQYEDIPLYVQKTPVDISWTINRAEFDELIALKKDSAPGPDGIPYGV